MTILCREIIFEPRVVHFCLPNYLLDSNPEVVCSSIGIRLFNSWSSCLVFEYPTLREHNGNSDNYHC